MDRVFAGTAGGSGTSGDLTLVIDGNVVASGSHGMGILAQSQASGGQVNISIDLAKGKIIYVGNGGVGVRISGGAQNRFVNNGGIGGADGLNTWAIIGEEGNEMIRNNGLIHGQVDLGSGINRLANNQGAELIIGPSYRIGGSARLGSKLILSLINPQLIQAGHFKKTLFAAGEGVTYDGL